jgi:uncharacterized protein YndB with AHSA1/START domain
VEFVKTKPGDDPIIVDCYFAAAPASVFQAWTNPDIVMKWFGPAPNSLHSADIDLHVGGRWRFVESINDKRTLSFEGEYIAIDVNERLVFTWSQVITHKSGDHKTGDREATPPSEVEITLSSNGDGTDIRLTHSSIQDAATRTGFAGGWERAFNSFAKLFSNAGG